MVLGLWGSVLDRTWPLLLATMTLLLTWMLTLCNLLGISRLAVPKHSLGLMATITFGCRMFLWQRLVCVRV